MAKAFDKNIFSATEAREDPESDVVAGSMLPIQCNQVHATGTTANNIIALF